MLEDDNNELELARLGISLEKGAKGEDDRIIKFKGERISMEQLGTLFSVLCKNEDRLHPYGKGGLYLLEFLQDIQKLGSLTDEIRRKYKLPIRD